MSEKLIAFHLAAMRFETQSKTHWLEGNATFATVGSSGCDMAT
jgi:hypothetical protein